MATGPFASTCATSSAAGRRRATRSTAPDTCRRLPCRSTRGIRARTYPYYPYYPGYGYPWVGFFVTEPEARVQIALGHAVAIDAGVSYRVVAAASGFDGLLRGAAGSIGVRFNLGQ